MSKQVTSKDGRSTNKQNNQQQDRPARMTRQAVKYERRQEDKRRRQEEQRRAARRKMNTIIGIVAAVVLILGGLGYFVYTNYVHPSANVVPTVVPTPVNPNYPAVNNVPCDVGEQTAVDYHNIVMKSHLLITLAYNSPGITPDTIFNWGTL